MTSRARTLAGVVVALGLGCGRTKGAPSGAEGGNCLPNATCNDGLRCFSGLCVRYGDAGATDVTEAGADAATGADAAGGAGATGAAGNDASVDRQTPVDEAEPDATGDASDAKPEVSTTEVGGSAGDGGAADGARDGGAADGAGGAAGDASSDACVSRPDAGSEQIVAGACGYTPATTVRAYSGVVTMTVSGLYVNSPNSPLEDAFYIVGSSDPTQSAGACPDCFRYNRLSEGACVCSTECPASSHLVSDLLVDPYPAFSPTHTYTVRLDLGAGAPAQLDFGMADCGCNDNSGTHTIDLVAGDVCAP